MSARHEIPAAQVMRTSVDAVGQALGSATIRDAGQPELPYRDAAWIRAFVAAAVWGRR